MADRQQFFAKKSLGQNFLTDPGIIRQIVDAIDLSPNDSVIEIGPGRGALTDCLIEKAANVIAIELDRELVPQLRDRYNDHENFSVLEADALEIDLVELVKDDKVKLVANLPYYISTAILQRLAEQRHYLSSLVLMFQREVVDRITARPGDSERGFLTVIVEAAFSTEKLFDVPPCAFEPQPKVWSSVVRMTPTNRKSPHEGFRGLLSTGFAMKRKTIANNLKTAYPNYAAALETAGIAPKSRAETLTLEQWLLLDDCIRSLG